MFPAHWVTYLMIFLSKYTYSTKMKRADVLRGFIKTLESADIQFATETARLLGDWSKEGYQITYAKHCTEIQEKAELLIIQYSTLNATLNCLHQVQNGMVDKNIKSFSTILIQWPNFINAKADFQSQLATTPIITAVLLKFKYNVTMVIVIRVGPDLKVYRVYEANGALVYKEVKEETNFQRCLSSLDHVDANGQVIRIGSSEDTITDISKGSRTNMVQWRPSAYNIGVTTVSHLLQILHSRLNLTFELVSVTETEANDSWTRLADAVENGVVDLGISSRNFPTSRGVSYLPPVSDDLLCAFFRRPEENSIRDIFVQPFDRDLWAVALCTWLLLAFAMSAISYVRQKHGANDGNGCEIDSSFVQDSLLMMLGTVAQQGWEQQPRSLSLRVIVLSASIASVVAYAGYSAAIVSTLSTNADPIQKVSDLFRSNLRIGIAKSALDDWDLRIKDSSDALAENFYRRQSSKTDERTANQSYGCAVVLQRPYAFVSGRGAFYESLRLQVNESMMCEIRELPIMLQRIHAGFLASKKFVYTEPVRQVLILLRERGILWRLRLNLKYVRRCLEVYDSTSRALGLNDVFTAFMILFAGYTLSFFTLFTEKLVNRKLNTYVQYL